MPNSARIMARRNQVDVVAVAVTICLIFLGCLLPISAQSREPSYEELAREQIWLLPGADPRVDHAVRLIRGIEMEVNFRQGYDLLEKAAADGSVEALYFLGRYALIPIWPLFDPDSGTELLRQAAERGSAAAMGQLATLYHDGEFVTADAEQSRYWAERAQTSGDPVAAWHIAVWRLDGEALPLDVEGGLSQMRVLMAAGHLPAKRTLGSYLLDFGENERQREKGARLLTEAAEAGEPFAQLELGLRLFDGLWFPRNRERAKRWLRCAGRQGNLLAMWDLWRLDAARYGQPGGPEWEDLLLNYEWLEKAAQGGLFEAQRGMAIFHSWGFPMEEDTEQVRVWTRRAANSAIHGSSLYELGRDLWYNGKPFGDELWGLSLVILAAKANYSAAALNLAFHYERGRFVRQDFELARYWYERVGEPSTPGEAYEMASIVLEFGRKGIDDYPERGRELLREAANQGYSMAQFKIGEALLTGEFGFMVDREAGRAWIRRAVGNDANADELLSGGDPGPAPPAISDR